MKKNRREEREGHIGSATLAVTVTTNSHAPSNNGYSAPVLFQPNTHTHTYTHTNIHSNSLGGDVGGSNDVNW